MIWKYFNNYMHVKDAVIIQIVIWFDVTNAVINCFNRAVLSNHFAPIQIIFKNIFGRTSKLNGCEKWLIYLNWNATLDDGGAKRCSVNITVLCLGHTCDLSWLRDRQLEHCNANNNTRTEFYCPREVECTDRRRSLRSAHSTSQGQ